MQLKLEHAKKLPITCEFLLQPPLMQPIKVLAQENFHGSFWENSFLSLFKVEKQRFFYSIVKNSVRWLVVFLFALYGFAMQVLLLEKQQFSYVYPYFCSSLVCMFTLNCFVYCLFTLFGSETWRLANQGGTLVHWPGATGDSANKNSKTQQMLAGEGGGGGVQTMGDTAEETDERVTDMLPTRKTGVG